MPRKSAQDLLRERYEKLPSEVRDHFWQFPEIIEKIEDLRLALTYMFYRVEWAHTTSLYIGLRKTYGVQAEGKTYAVDAYMAKQAMDSTHMTREKFQDSYETVFSKDFPKNAAEKIKLAQQVRDKLMHGMRVSDAQVTEALLKIMEYTKLYHDAVREAADFSPFGSQQGVTGATKSLDKKVSCVILKGLGFHMD